MRLTEIEDKNIFFEEFDISKRSMTHLLYVKGTDSFYESFEIPKKNGGFRNIDAPKGKLKYVQKRLAEILWETQIDVWKKYANTYEYNLYQKNLKDGIRYRVPMISHAFEVNKSIMTNAKIHRNKKFIINVDLKDFFKSFHFGRVKGFFEKNKDFKVPTEVAVIIAQLSCYKGVLPQGAPSSPIITNLICQIMDYRIMQLAKRFKLNYTRYADDLTFSTNNVQIVNEYQTFLKKLEKKIVKAGFEINEDKTRLQFNNSRQTVTGLIVNKKLNVPREYYKDTRAMANTLYKTGSFDVNERTGSINQLNGRFAFINQLDKYNNKLENNASIMKNNIEYQKYLLSVEKKEKNI
ncbi:reverse transcriptase domain-containing protein [Candidatus Enterococcus huntleyi]|uniref:reverse transcriptase domain-containing protein n=1 Tax=Candidatus Enterococcus huntleyi TaxID=1857217 RepID=UPI001F184DCE|nr:reverse transcriptase domain-containing protein [Enterococcus sp. JM4C]